MTADVTGEVIGDSLVECWAHYIMPNKKLVAQFDYIGDSIKVDGIIIENGKTEIDYSKPIKVTIYGNSTYKDYHIYFYSFTGLPVVWIETEGRKEISSKYEYIRAKIKIEENVTTRSAGEIFEDSVSIKGRGNTSWRLSTIPKKSYRLKFDKKQTILNEPKDKSWNLIANYSDKTMLRNQTAYYMSSLSNLDYTPNYHFAEVMLNGRYHGTYQLGDKLKISKNRVDVGDDGFLLEIDYNALFYHEDVYFNTPNLDNPVCIKDPDVIEGDENYEYAKQYINLVDSVLFSEDFKNLEKGYRKYIDVNSFVDWYLINEITKNIDATLVSSCFMNFKRGGKLKMGPVWDFDVAFGNRCQRECTYDGFLIKSEKASWFYRLFQDPFFVNMVKERFEYFYNKKDDIYSFINEYSTYLKYSVEENENRWHTLYVETYPNYDIWGNYQNEVQYMKDWLSKRFEWLRTAFEQM